MQKLKILGKREDPWGVPDGPKVTFQTALSPLSVQVDLNQGIKRRLILVDCLQKLIVNNEAKKIKQTTGSLIKSTTILFHLSVESGFVG